MNQKQVNNEIAKRARLAARYRSKIFKINCRL